MSTGVIGNIVIGMSANVVGFTRDMRKGADAVGAFAASAARAQVSARGFTSFKALAAGIGAFAGIRAATSGIVSAASSASDLNEQVSKATTVFGEAVSVVERGAREMGDAFGYPKKEFYDAASSIGLIGKASGLTQAAAAELGTNFARLAADASSFYNVGLDEALMSIRSGLVDEAEPMRRFGVLLSAQAVEAEAAAQGFRKANGAYSEGAKVQARAALISRGLADATGDLARTSGSAANQVRSIWGRLENLGADIGTAIAPATDSILNLANAGFKVLAQEITASREAVKLWAGEASSASGSILSGFEAVGKAVGFVADLVEAANVVVKGWRATMLDFAATSVRVLKDVLDTIGRVQTAILPSFKAPDTSAIDEWAKNLEKKAADAWQGVRDAIGTAAPSTLIEEFFQKTRAAALETAGAIGTASNSIKQMATATASLAPKVEELVSGLQAEIATMGMSSDQAEIYKLRLAGASDEQLNLASTLAAQKARMEEALKVIDDTRTPLEKYRLEQAKLDNLLANGTLTQEQHRRASDVAKGTLSDASTPKSIFAPAAELGSQEARDAILRSDFSGFDRAEPDKEVARNTKQSVDIETRMLEALNRLANKGLDGAVNAGLNLFSFQ